MLQLLPLFLGPDIFITNVSSNTLSLFPTHKKGKGKAILQQAWTGPQGCSKFRLPEFLNRRHLKVLRLSTLSIGRPYRPGNMLGIHVLNTQQVKSSRSCAFHLATGLEINVSCSVRIYFQTNRLIVNHNSCSSTPGTLFWKCETKPPWQSGV